MARSPNILFVQVDQLTASSLRAYGDTVCQAPHLDQLADGGIVFETAYCNFPLCAPSRFSMATGQLCSSIGAYDNAAEMPASVPTYAHYLRALGYQTALSGKMHFIGPDQYHGFETRLTADLYPADFSWVPNWGDEGERDTNDPRSVQISGICERSVQIDFDEEVTFKAIQHIYDLARSPDKRPFFLQVSYTHPHEPYLCRKEYWDLYETADIPMPAVPSLSTNEHDPHSIRLLRDFGMLDFRFEEEDIQRARRGYYGSISYIDRMLGRILETLRATGLAGNTAVIFTSDHGEMLGERGMWFKKHFFEPALRIPFLVHAPWIAPRRITTPISLVDVLPTLCGLATGSGKSGPPWESRVEPLEGKDLYPLMMGAEEQPDRPIFAEYLAEATTAPILMIRRGRYKFITCATDPHLLFDVLADPQELTNLAEHPDHRTRIADFEALAAQKWDSDTLSKDIILSQKRRQMVRNTQDFGVKTRWNHNEDADDKVLWYRGEGTYNAWAFDYLSLVET